MSMHDYEQVIDAFCKEASIPNVDAVLRNKLVQFGNAMVQLNYNDDLDCCRVQVGLSRPDYPYSPEFMYLMLETNAGLEAPGLPTFGIDEQSGNAVLMLHFPVARLRQGPSLFAILDANLDSLLSHWNTLLASISGDEDGQKESTTAGYFV